MLFAMLLMMTAAQPAPFAWVTYIPGESIIHGIAETDSRDLRIDCTTGGRLDVIVWSDVAAASGATVPVVLKANGKSYRVPAVVFEGDMPQLVAAFHSLVGLAAVLVGLAAYLNPIAFGIAGPDGVIEVQSRIEMGLGIAIGAITFSGSIIAFLKLAGKMSGAPIMLPGRHVINLGTLAWYIEMFINSPPLKIQNKCCEG